MLKQGIGGAFCLIGALLFGIGFVSGGTKYVHATNLNAMNAQSDQDAKENHFTLEKTELSDFNSLNVSLKNSDFNIKESPNEKSYIEYVQETTKAKNPLSYSIKNNTLTLKENGNTGASYTISVDISFLIVFFCFTSGKRRSIDCSVMGNEIKSGCIFCGVI